MCDEEDRLPSLGDFTKIRRHVATHCEPQGVRAPGLVSESVGPVRHQLVEARAGAQLGDFDRLFSRLEDENAASKTSASNTRTRVLSIIEPKASLYSPQPECSKRSCKPVLTHSPLSSKSCPSPVIIVSQSGLDETVKPAKLSRGSKAAERHQSAMGRVTSYQLDEKGPWIPIFDKLRSKRQKGDLLSEKLKPLYTLDTLRAIKRPDVGVNGVHIFLDMSNINISFQKMIRIRYSIDASARFSPSPPLDLQLLTEILVRKRHVVSLNAGCSVPPGRNEPRYIQELRECGYHVDLRERKRILTGFDKPAQRKSGATDSSSSEGKRVEAGTIRYVEDLVDETLQTRIAESVMKHFEDQGTLVLATGDAQPAKYSDGFLAYAERSLKMGWDVEVVSWKKSLSSHWTNADWTASWGDHFRVIELDGFLEDLLACSA